MKRFIILLLPCMLFLDCKCDDTLGSAFPPQNLKITIENSLIRDALVVELDCFFEDPDLSILNLNTAFDLELTAISLDSDLVMMTDDYSFTDTRFQTKSGISTSSTVFEIPYPNTETGVTITGIITFTECSCCCAGPADEFTCPGGDCDQTICTNAGKPTFSLFGVNLPIETDEGIRYFDELTLIPTLEPCVDCGCEADTNEC